MYIYVILCILVQLRCSEDKGSYILKVKIHLDDLTIKKILAVESLKNMSGSSGGKRQAVLDYLNSIFNELNKDIKDHQVQVIGDYSFLNFEDLETNLDMNKMCFTKFMAIESTMKLSLNLSYPNTEGLGLRIIGLSCKAFEIMQIPFFTMPNFGCGNIGTIFVLDPLTLKFQIKFLIKNFITGNMGGLLPARSKAFKKLLNNFSSRCTKNNDLIGTFIRDLSKVKEERKMLKEQKNEN